MTTGKAGEVRKGLEVREGVGEGWGKEREIENEMETINCNINSA